MSWAQRFDSVKKKAGRAVISQKGEKKRWNTEIGKLERVKGLGVVLR